MRHGRLSAAYIFFSSHASIIIILNAAACISGEGLMRSGMEKKSREFALQVDE